MLGSSSVQATQWYVIGLFHHPPQGPRIKPDLEYSPGVRDLSPPQAPKLGVFGCCFDCVFREGRPNRPRCEAAHESLRDVASETFVQGFPSFYVRQVFTRRGPGEVGGGGHGVQLSLIHI